MFFLRGFRLEDLIFAIVSRWFHLDGPTLSSELMILIFRVILIEDESVFRSEPSELNSFLLLTFW
jgi:hypothetical protein